MYQEVSLQLTFLSKVNLKQVRIHSLPGGIYRLQKYDIARAVMLLCNTPALFSKAQFY